MIDSVGLENPSMEMFNNDDREGIYVFMKTWKNRWIDLLKKVNRHNVENNRMKSSDFGFIGITYLKSMERIFVRMNIWQRTLARTRNNRRIGRTRRSNLM